MELHSGNHVQAMAECRLWERRMPRNSIALVAATRFVARVDVPNSYDADVRPGCCRRPGRHSPSYHNGIALASQGRPTEKNMTHSTVASRLLRECLPSFVAIVRTGKKPGKANFPGISVVYRRLRGETSSESVIGKVSPRGRRSRREWAVLTSCAAQRVFTLPADARQEALPGEPLEVSRAELRAWGVLDADNMVQMALRMIRAKWVRLVLFRM